MLRTALRRLRDEEDGFTLIELMVVVMILAILIVMGLPTFLGVKARFQDRAAQTDLRNVGPGRSDHVHGQRHVHHRPRRARPGSSPSCRTCATWPERQRRRPSTPGRSPARAARGTDRSASTRPRRSSRPLACPRRRSCFVILDATTGTKYGKTTAAQLLRGLGDAGERDRHHARRRRLVAPPTRFRVFPDERSGSPRIPQAKRAIGRSSTSVGAPAGVPEKKRKELRQHAQALHGAQRG